MAQPSTSALEQPLSDSFRHLGSITKLRSEWEFIKWSRELNDAFDLINGNFWEILCGDRPMPAEPEYAVTSSEDVRRYIADRDRIPVKRVTQEELKSTIQDHIRENVRIRERYESTMELWKDQNWRALSLLKSTIDCKPQQCISGIWRVREAYLKLLSNYGSSWQNAVLKWSKWTAVRFEQDMTPKYFVMTFHNALQELLLVIDPAIVPSIVQYIQFVDSMRYHGRAHKFLATVRPDGDPANLMKTTYEHFLACGPYKP
ncbi:uncharacterized protein N7477_001927 [Penicillium maclennaniae]|uniref:uncharacterized protein n=1 Tax=Penicillium maclennaniae TaxID=1343394 RepID=UPI002540BB11|nr:uncharacterized protein N7477_001927 [Penicillium maclennaniae]KAJ5681987.1 hypothetical protein N7477_001927 [Penicillium maclennaniae]